MNLTNHKFITWNGKEDVLKIYTSSSIQEKEFIYSSDKEPREEIPVFYQRKINMDSPFIQKALKDYADGKCLDVLDCDYEN